MYAATLRYHAGVFYVITTNFDGPGNFYVTATDPAGPWSDPIFVDPEMFDPDLFFDEDGAVYYTRRGSFESKDLVQAKIDIATGRLISPMRSIAKGFVSDDTEAPHIYKINGWYYLLAAEGGSRFLHMATIARSQTPAGPWEPCPHNPIFAQHHAWWHPIRSIGHGDLIEDHQGNWWIVFLGTRHAYYDAFSAIGRETFLAPVRWENGWPVILPQAMRQFEVEAPLLPQHPWPETPSRDDFDAPELKPAWVFPKFPQPDAVDLKSRPGFLRLSNALVGQRQRDIEFTATTLLDDSDSAGICVYQRDDFRYDLLRARRDGQRVIILRRQLGDLIHETLSPAPAGPLRLRITADARQYHFSFAIPDGPFHEIGAAPVQLIATEVVGTWAGAIVGLFVTGASADFDWFEYE